MSARLAALRASALLAAVLFAIRCDEAGASPPAPTGALASQAAAALSEDAGASTAAIAALRARGDEGLDALLALEPETVVAGAPVTFPPSVEPSPATKRWRLAVDAVAGQKDAWASRLYWHEDLDAAKAVARREKKPIVSLAMLGRLDEDCSCANSRFFRTVLYANADVSAALRDRFVLHWRSMRPVPKVTIDFGGGRKIERTITGNSVHLVLDAEGRPVDAIPGLYGPAAFLRALSSAEGLVLRVAGMNPAERAATLARAHGDAAHASDVAWSLDLDRVRAAASATGAAGAPTAEEAGNLAVSKRKVEAPVLSSLSGKARSEGGGAPVAVDDATWAAVAALHQDEARLDAGSRTLVLAKSPDLARAAMRLSMSKARVEDPLLRVLRPLERSIAEDTVRNEYALHRVIHGWFVGIEVGNDPDAFAERIYADVFLTPSSDPWLGLAPADAFSALDGDGLVVPGALAAPSR